MRVVIQRVKNCSLSIDGTVYSSISKGLLVFAAFENSDTEEDITWVSKKIIDLRIFPDNDGKMNLSVKDIDGEIMIVSQFTLFASTKKGNRPSFTRSANYEIGLSLYNIFVEFMNNFFKKPIKTGVFGANMDIALVNYGPVTIIIDSKFRE